MGDEKLRDSMPQMLGKSGGVNQGHFRPFLIRHFLGESCLYLRMVSKKWSSIPVLRLSSRCVRIMALFEAAAASHIVRCCQGRQLAGASEGDPGLVYHSASQGVEGTRMKMHKAPWKAQSQRGLEEDRQRALAGADELLETQSNSQPDMGEKKLRDSMART